MRTLEWVVEFTLIGLIALPVLFVLLWGGK
jgi:hypothetical protein